MSGTGNQFSYDANGNLIQDAFNNNNEILYDHRNLITELKHRSMIIDDTVYLTKYYYDEAGSRIRKMTYAYLGKLSEGEPPANSDVSNTNNWSIRNDEVYSRDVSGRDLAIYKNNSVLEYPFYGLDMVGKIKEDELYFYLKDHLGSIRAVLYENKIFSSQDYDAWGYILEGRTYQSEEGKFKFTGKERDEESFYDYFGARYYDSRIGRWGQVEPLLDKYPQFSPFVFSIDNPLIVLDPDGKDPRRNQLGSLNDIVNILENNIGKPFTSVHSLFSRSQTRYIYTEIGGFIDLQHFFAASATSAVLGPDKALKLGELVEELQEKENNPSTFDPEDLPSNLQGAIYGTSINSLVIDEEYISNFIRYIKNLSPVEKDDPSIASDKLYIPIDEFDIPLPQSRSYSPYRENYPTIENL